MEVYVIRHTPVALGKNMCYGQSDVPLADSFDKDVEIYKNQLPTHFDKVYSSPSPRCKALVSALQYPNVAFHNYLHELNFGDWENKDWNEINQTELNHWMNDFVNIKVPNGESLQELFQRVKLFFDDLRQKNYQSILIVTHAGVIRCLWAYLLDIPLNNVFKIPVGYHEMFMCKLAKNPMEDSIKLLK